MTLTEFIAAWPALKRQVRSLDVPWLETMASLDRDPFKVLVSCILSLRTQDKVTGEASERLFALAPTPEGLAHLSVDRIEEPYTRQASTGCKARKPKAMTDRQFVGRYARLRPALDYDGRFAETLSGKTLALGYYFITPGLPAGVTGALPRANLPAGAMGDSQNKLVEAIGYGGNLKQFQDAAGIAGYFSVLPDADGTMRKLHLLTRYQGGLYESFSAATLRAAMGADPLAAGVEEKRFLGRGYRQPWVEVAGIRVNLNADGSAWVPYRAGAPFPYVSAKDVLAGKTGKGVLENRVVLVGSTAPGLADLRVTPFSSAFPGVEIHAHMIAGMLDGDTGHTPPWALDAVLAVTLATGLLLAFALPLISPVWQAHRQFEAHGRGS